MVKDLLNANCAKAELRALEAYSFEQLLHVQCAHSRHFFFHFIHSSFNSIFQNV